MDAVDYTEGRTSLVAATAGEEERSAFLVRTYLHLAGAIVAFVLLEGALLATGTADAVCSRLFQFGRFAWVVVLLAFIGAALVADGWARSGGSKLAQYAGLSLYVVVQAVIAMPLLWVAGQLSPVLVPAAGLVTLLGALALTGAVFWARRDFSFLRSFLAAGALVAIATVLAAIVFDFALGAWFAGAMVLFACGSILHTTSAVLHRYKPAQHVAASLALFAGVALLFRSVLHPFTASRR